MLVQGQMVPHILNGHIEVLCWSLSWELSEEAAAYSVMAVTSLPLRSASSLPPVVFLPLPYLFSSLSRSFFWVVV